MTHNGRCVNPQVITPGPVRGDAQRPARTGSPKRTARKNMTAESVDYKAMQEAVHNYLTSRKAGIFFSVSGVSVVPVYPIISIPHNTYNRIITRYKKYVLIDGISTVYRQSLPRILFSTSAYFPGLTTHLKLPHFSGLLFPARMPQFLRPPAAVGSTAFFFP